MNQNTAQNIPGNNKKVHVKGVANILGVSPHTIQSYEKAGLLSFDIASDGQKLYQLQDVLNLKKSIEHGATPPAGQNPNNPANTTNTPTPLNPINPINKEAYNLMGKSKLLATVLLVSLLSLFGAYLYTSQYAQDPQDQELPTQPRAQTTPRRTPNFVFGINTPTVISDSLTVTQDVTIEGNLNVANQSISTLGINTQSVNLSGLATLNGLLGIDDVTKQTLEDALEIVPPDDSINQDQLAEVINYDGEFTISGELDITGDFKIDGETVEA